MGITTELHLELSGAVSDLWGAMRRVKRLEADSRWRRVTWELEEARVHVKEVRAEITALKRKYGIKKRGYAISVSDLPRGG
jgi:hypothetical protein